ncbi:MAG: alpha/beta fold hydrolase [Candidatus Binatia bacterium]
MAYRSDRLDVRGTSTHVLRGGRGDPLLVLHPEFAARTWAPYHDALAARFHLIAPDHPGFGDSACPEWIDTVDDLVFHYLDLLDALALERVAVVGTSFGGWIAAALAVAHPERIERMVLAAPAGVRVDGVARYDYFANPLEETARRLFHDPTRAAQLRLAEAGAEDLVRGHRELTTLARLSWNPYLFDPKLQQRLPRVRTPTLIVWGDDDTVLPPAHGELFASLMPCATLRRLAACGHLPPFERAEAFAGAAIAFLTA